MSANLDETYLQTWVGKTMRSDDIITPQLIRAFRATLDRDIGEPKSGDVAPYAIHWCLSQPTVPMDEIGADGHPARGGFLPPVPLPRRMWAGGRLAFHAPFYIGDEVERVSTVKSVSLKTGKSGRLCFVVVEHRCNTKRGLALVETHDIVYRDLETAGANMPIKPDDLPEPDVTRNIAATPLLLFRYSALTFNGHRIHYDRDYVTRVEGYPGLIVHGPLQASLLVDLASTMRPAKSLATFSFRAMRPLFDGGEFSVNGAIQDETSAKLWTARSGGTHMMADAVWS